MRLRRRRLAVSLCAMALAAAACGDDDGGGDAGGRLEDTGEVTLLSAVSQEEAGDVQAIFDELINSQVEYTATIEAAGDFEQQFQIRAEAGTLDLAAVPQPGAIADLAEAGHIVALEDLGFDIGEIEETFGADFVALGEYEGKHYGLPTNINLKSMVWYPKDDFDAAGYEVPETWDELIALSEQIIDDGGTPWCIGFESEGASGWPATDWMEDIVLRTAGPEVYDQWVAHEIPFDDPAIVHAAEVFGEILFADGFVLGGAADTATIPFGDAPRPMFDDPPGCWLHRQASFINSFFPEDAEAGVDYDWFPLPPIDQEGTLYAGELTVVGRGGNRAEVIDFLERFMGAEVQCEMGSVVGSSRISPNVEVGPDCYANDILADASVILTEALASGTGRFDASDLMPPAVGSGSFWTAMLDYVRSDGPEAAAGILAEVEASFPTD